MSSQSIESWKWPQLRRFELITRTSRILKFDQHRWNAHLEKCQPSSEAQTPDFQRYPTRSSIESWWGHLGPISTLVDDSSYRVSQLIRCSLSQCRDQESQYLPQLWVTEPVVDWSGQHCLIERYSQGIRVLLIDRWLVLTAVVYCYATSCHETQLWVYMRVLISSAHRVSHCLCYCSLG